MKKRKGKPQPLARIYPTALDRRIQSMSDSALRGLLGEVRQYRGVGYVTGDGAFKELRSPLLPLLATDGMVLASETIVQLVFDEVTRRWTETYDKDMLARTRAKTRKAKFTPSQRKAFWKRVRADVKANPSRVKKSKRKKAKR